MSEQGNDNRYARWWEPVVVSLMIAALLLFISVQLRSEIRDLQRRVAELEQRK